MNRLKNEDIEWMITQLDLRVFSGHIGTPSKKRFQQINNDYISQQKDLRNLYYHIWDEVDAACSDARYNVFGTTLSFSVLMGKTVQPNVTNCEVVVCLDDTRWIEKWMLDEPKQIESTCKEIKEWLDSLATSYERAMQDNHNGEPEYKQISGRGKRYYINGPEPDGPGDELG